MRLTERPKSVERTSIHFAYVEKTGPFMKTAPEAWAQLGKTIAALERQSKIVGKLSLFKVEGNKHTLQAGVSLDSKPATLPKGARYARLRGGRYASFVLTGPYSDLPMAWARVMELTDEKKLKVRPSFCIENYVSEGDGPEGQPVTELLVPIRARRKNTKA